MRTRVATENKLFCWCMLLVLWHAHACLGEAMSLSFATAAEARGILTNRDDFVRSMSPFDRAARMKTAREVFEATYLEFAGNNILAWSDAEKRKVTAAFEGLQPKLQTLALPFPAKGLLIKTTGNEEGEAPYTRANAIILPKADLAKSATELRRSICHELFHVLTRANPELREKLYAVIGFQKCGELEFPAELKARKITNPDAPANDHCIRLKIAGRDIWAIPILFSGAEKYSAARGGLFFDYMQFQFLVVERASNGPGVKAVYDGRKPRLAGMEQITGFMEQVGRNTEYIIHPEEILADNFVLLVADERDVASPEILEKMRKVLDAAGKADPGAAKGAGAPGK